MKEAVTLTSTLVILFVLVASQKEPETKRVLLDESGENLLMLKLVKDNRGNEEIKGCQLFTDKDSVESILRTTPYSDVQRASKEEIQDTIDDCTALSESRRNVAELNDERRRPIQLNRTQGTDESEVTTEGYSGVPVILPGTKWCGAGQNAKQIQDLGYYEDTDQCCRAHDLCNDTMAPGETRNNLTNSSPFTALNCQCDLEFYDCLEKINSVVSNAVGNMYFNVLLRRCYTYDHPDGGCKTYRSFLKVTCKEYGKNTTAPKTWRWVSAKRYKTLPIPGPITITLDF